MNQGTPLASHDSGTKPSRRGDLVAAGVLAATGILLGVAYFPMLFNGWQTYDDEGVFVVSLRELLHHHGSLYNTIWSDKYGPFYYLVMSTVYRVLHQDPTLANGRWIVLVVTAASASLFGGAVWRVTKNLPCSILCQVGTFVILIQSAGNEPMHPGSLSVLLIAAVAYEASSYAVKRGRAQLIGLGAATGALLMTKLNTGGLVAIAIVTVFVVGSSRMPRLVRIAVAGLAALALVILMLQNVSANWVAVLAFLVSGSVLGMCVLMSVDLLSLPRASLLWVAAGAAVVCVCSLAFPLFSGTSLSAVMTGVFVKPLDQAGQLTVPANVSVDWFYLLLTAGGIYAGDRGSLPTDRIGPRQVQLGLRGPCAGRAVGSRPRRDLRRPRRAYRAVATGPRLASSDRVCREQSGVHAPRPPMSGAARRASDPRGVPSCGIAGRVGNGSHGRPLRDRRRPRY